MLQRLIQSLSRKEAYPETVAEVAVRQTHISVVFLAGVQAYKIKKPVQLGFVDFSTLEKRRFFCDEEVRLNRRLAPQVYLGVVPVTEQAGRIGMEGPGTIIDWAVKMRRLPEEATLQSRLRAGSVGPDKIAALATRIAAFHAEAEGSEHIAQFGRFDTVAGNARDNFASARLLVGTTVSVSVFQRLQVLTEETLKRLRDLIEDRARRGVPRDTHGDLRLEHVYLFPEQVPPDDLIIIDCIEFNERFRFADPVADMAFVVMDLAFHGRRDLARIFRDAYFEASGDADGPALVPFYTAYRAAVRGKVEGFKLCEAEVPPAERKDELTRARGHWLLALGELEKPGRKPCLLLVGGLPGAGKSTLAANLARNAAFQLIRSDLVRKELAGQAGVRPVATFEQGIYSQEWTDRTYEECSRQAQELLFGGGRVLVDASFGLQKHRDLLLSAGRKLGVPVSFFHCRADPETSRRRLESRRQDASDADWSVFQKAVAAWETVSCPPDLYKEIDSNGNPQEVLEKALGILRELDWY